MLKLCALNLNGRKGTRKHIASSGGGHNTEMCGLQGDKHKAESHDYRCFKAEFGTYFKKTNVSPEILFVKGIIHNRGFSRVYSTTTTEEECPDSLRPDHQVLF